MSVQQLGELVVAAVGAVLRDRALSFPWYQPGLHSEADAVAATAELPLFYSWGEVAIPGQPLRFTVSINRVRLATVLASHLPRTDPTFPALLNTVARVLHQNRNEMLCSMCAEFRATPSQLSRALAGTASGRHAEA